LTSRKSAGVNLVLTLDRFNDPSATDMKKPKSILPEWKDEPLKFAFNPDEALRRCAYNRLPTSRKKSVKTRLKSR